MDPPRLRGLPLLGSALSFLRDPVGLLWEARRRLGPVFAMRLGDRDAVVLLGPEHHRAFFEQTDRLLSIREAYPFFHRMFHDRLYFMADAGEYREQRAIITPLFQGPRLAGHLAAMLTEAERFLAGLGDEGVLDLPQVLGPLVMHVAARALLGDAFRDRLGDGLFDVFRDFSGGIDPVLPPWLPLPRFRRGASARRQLHALVRAAVTERRRSPACRRDFLQELADARRSDGSPLDEDLLVGLVLMLLWAGHETTVGHLSWALIDLLRHPDYLLGVLAEGREVVKGGVIDLERAGHLRRLGWALKETERLHPHAYVLLRVASEALDIAGYAVPRGALVMVSPAVAGRLPEVFAEPDRYRPQRFASGRGEERGLHALIGFGGGSHRCAGVRFAQLEMKVVLSLLLGRYELELLDPDPQPVRGPRGKWPASPCRVRYRRRRDADL